MDVLHCRARLCNARAQRAKPRAAETFFPQVGAARRLAPNNCAHARLTTKNGKPQKSKRKKRIAVCASLVVSLFVCFDKANARKTVPVRFARPTSWRDPNEADDCHGAFFAHNTKRPWDPLRCARQDWMISVFL
ncbi:hypothetical protein TW95_gp0681 [Pandoravirus inopinatum]|uniref:Uncharacterized protein n=1 Tax=Pandoravirus inopinatum TaxID=1605721 RepID=A0A0B5J6M2_9VIRU|nr:hypothetical protein TW95_gp0681 [Pandoravirus inopinatum]AJF97415.1 hypothetical protein [Pandoravirus inopinatum]